MSDQRKEVELETIGADVERALRELVAAGRLGAGHLVVIGTSTSEVLGQRIGTAGTEQVAARIFAAVERVRREAGFAPAFQCCEHLNRALVVERRLLALDPTLEEVSVVPIPGAGGSMAAYAYRHLPDSCVVETVRAHAGIDIGDTLIGMHLRRVAVPVRPSVRSIGFAHVTMAITRPKLIGGSRAVYDPAVDKTKHSDEVGSCD